VATFSAGANFSILGQALGSSANAGIASEHGRDGDLVVDMTTTTLPNLSWIGVAIEVAGATGAPPPSEDIVLRRVRRRGLNARIN
jgi:hypothetical protein